MTAPNPVATFPVPALTGQYRMGPLLEESPAFDFWWNRALPDGTMTIAGEPAGWESATYILPLDEVGGRDGAFTGPQSVGPKVLEVSAMMVAPTAEDLRRNLAKIRQIFGPHTATGARQPVIWEQYDWGTGLRQALITRPQGTFLPEVVPGYRAGGVAARISFQLVASTPWKFQAGAAEFNQVGLRNPGLIEGRTYSKTFNYTYGSATSIGGEMVCVNNGNIYAYPVFIITGEADFPIITNVTTGQEWQVNHDLDPLEVVRVDSKTGVVTPSHIRIIGTPFPLQPGPNTIRWRTVSDAYHPEALLRLEWRSTFS
jgi:phage-related protein